MEKNIKEIITLLKNKYGTEPWNWHTQQNPFQILIGTVLSQRTKDINTDKAAKQLFAKYSTPEAIAKAGIKEIEKLIKPSGFYRQKAKRIKEISKIIVEKYNSKTPETIGELLELPGVGRKTANCVLVFGFRKPAIPVDVHVWRLSNRIGLAKTPTPEKTEMELMKVVPKKYWIIINELLVKHGQNICLPRSPKCEECPVNKYCNYYKENIKRYYD